MDMTKTSATAAAPDALLNALSRTVDPKGLITDPEAIEPYVVEERGLYHGRTPCVVKPTSTEEVAAVVRVCAEHGVGIVPQGGNTGLVGGGIPFDDGAAIVVSLARMNRIRAVDPLNDTLTAEAGCILQQVQEAATAADRLFPLSLGAEGTCQVGGNLSTNAGGVQVLRYGNARELVLGLEVVLPDGQIWDGLRGLRKNNTGYDLKQLFIGAEGTLGIITAAVLKLFPKPRQKVTAFAAVRDVAAAVELLHRLRARTGEAAASFELIPRIGLDLSLAHVTGVQDPLAERHDWHALIELWSTTEDGGIADGLEQTLAEAYEAGLVLDATVAASEAQAAALWRIREAMVEAQKLEGGSIKHDVSVPISSIPAFIEQASAAVARLIPGSRTVAFGHIGDGNIHFNLTQPKGADTQAFLARWAEVNGMVHDIVAGLNGSISAEHGIGRMKIAENVRHKAPVEIALMQKIKRAIDPDGIMNPGKVLPR